MYDHRDPHNRKRAKATLKRLAPRAKVRANSFGDDVDVIRSRHIKAFGETLQPGAIFSRTCGVHIYRVPERGFHADFELEGMPVGFPFVFGTPAAMPLPSCEEAEAWAIDELAGFIALEQASDDTASASPAMARFQVDELIMSIRRDFIESVMWEGYFPEELAGSIIDSFRQAMGGRLTEEGFRGLGLMDSELLNRAMVSLLLAGTPHYPRRWPRVR